ncbi:MAG TPA: transketolase family protein [Patescibacteria group bacterium]
MRNPKANLIKNLFSEKIEKIPTRNGYGEGLVEAGKKDKNVVALCGDLTESTRTEYFQKEFPDRFIEVGVAEQNMMGLAAGLALNGKIPFVSTYAVFCPGRNWDQTRVSVCYNNINVKLTGAHSGISVGPDGATHQALEDIAITRVLPNMTVLAPCDYHQTRRATVAAAKYPGPVYLRFARAGTPVFTTARTPFKICQADVYWEGKDVTIIGAGPLVYEALKAAQELKKDKISARVINCHTIKPIDKETISRAAKETGAIVTIEEHQIHGGLGSAVAEVVVQNQPVPMEIIGVPDRFGESGEPEELLEHYGLVAKNIVTAVKRILKKK